MNIKDVVNTTGHGVLACVHCGRMKHAIRSKVHHENVLLVHQVDKTSKCCSSPSYWWVVK